MVESRLRPEESVNEYVKQDNYKFYEELNEIRQIASNNLLEHDSRDIY